LRFLLMALAFIVMSLPFAANAYAAEQNDELLKIEDFNQAPPDQTAAHAASFAIASSGAVFSDVPEGYWAKEEIEFLYQRSIIQGYQQGSQLQFRPLDSLTRAQAAKMLMLAIGEKEPTTIQVKFKDVPSSHWAARWISLAAQKGIFTGYDDGSFHPNDKLKRSQMSKVLALTFSLSNPPANAKKPFTDVSSSYWAYSYIMKLYYNGISNGSGNKFMPESYISRDQFSAFLARAMSDQFRLPVSSADEGTVIAKGKVTAQTLNVRSSGSTNALVVGQLSNGTIVNVYSIQGYWAKISYGNLRGYVHKSYLKLQNVSGSVLAGRIITVDAGHGGTDPGTIGNGANEKDIVLSVAKKLKQKLEAAGAKVIMTRESDTYPTLEERVNIAKQNYAELFISIHVNSASPSAKGTETYYDTSTNPNGYESYLLAKEVQAQIVANANMVDRKVKDEAFYVIRNNTVPSILVELGFISNTEDVKKLTSDQFQNIFAESIYNGIVQYYKK
jgi:N-acetylmuramoyl-L-alanine amidase